MSVLWNEFTWLNLLLNGIHCLQAKSEWSGRINFEVTEWGAFQKLWSRLRERQFQRKKKLQGTKMNIVIIFQLRQKHSPISHSPGVISGTCRLGIGKANRDVFILAKDNCVPLRFLQRLNSFPLYYFQPITCKRYSRVLASCYIVCLDFIIFLLPLPQSQAKLPGLVVIPDSMEISIFKYIVIPEYKWNE